MLTAEQKVRLTAIFRSLFNMPGLELTDGLTAADIPGWDSFNHVNLVYAIEEEFSTRFTTDEFAGWKNVGELMRSLAGKLP